MNIEYFYENENIYIEEIDRLERTPEETCFLLDKENNGWFCMAAEENTADWNIARLIGNPEKAEKLIDSIPFDDCVLLTDETVILTHKKLENNGKLIIFESSSNFISEEELSFTNQSSEGSYLNGILPAKSVRTRVSPIDSVIDDIYLYHHNGINGFIKVTRKSWHYSEVAVEVKSELRGQGFGTALLAAMLEQFRLRKRKMIYAVEEDNLPSIKIATKCNLKKIHTLNRLRLRVKS